MVLANGQYMFSCAGAGAYSLNVPLDDKGQVTLFAFADGFAPFSVTAAPAALPSAVRTQTAAPNSPLIAMTRDVECGANNWVRVSGEIESFGGDPLCAMVLSNGQHMFSCGASQGRYDLTVPADENGNVTVFGFADGFQPYSETFVAPECAFDTFDGTYRGTATSNTPFPPGVTCGTGYFDVDISGNSVNGSGSDSWGRSYSILGNVDPDGAIAFGLAASIGNVANFNGNVTGSTMNGIWSDVFGCQGSWSGSKQ